MRRLGPRLAHPVPPRFRLLPRPHRLHPQLCCLTWASLLLLSPTLQLLAATPVVGPSLDRPHPGLPYVPSTRQTLIVPACVHKHLVHAYYLPNTPLSQHPRLSSLSMRPAGAAGRLRKSDSPQLRASGRPSPLTTLQPGPKSPHLSSWRIRSRSPLYWFSFLVSCTANDLIVMTTES